MNAALADVLEIWGFEKDIIIYSDGSLGFGLEVTPIDVATWDDDRINGYAQRTAHFLNGLPSGIDIQFIQEITRGNAAVINAHEALGEKAENAAATLLTEKRVLKLKYYDEEGISPRHSMKIFVRRPFGQSLVERKSIFSNQNKFPKIAQSALEDEVIKFSSLRDDVMRSLASLDLRSKQLNSDEIVDLCYSQWNPTRRIKRADFDPEDVRSSIIFTDAVIEETGFSLSDMHHRVISVKLMPDQTFSSMARALRDLPFDSKVFVTVHVPDQQKEIEGLQLQRRLAFSMARGRQVGVSDIDSEAKLQDLETLLSEMIAQGEKVFQVSINVLLRSQDKALLESQCSETLMKIRELAGAEAMVESLASFDIFSSFSVPNARAKERVKRVKTSTLSDLLPIYGPWRGYDQPSLILRSLQGSLIGFDPFSGELTNANQILSGGSGSGKSFLTNILLLQLLKENPKIFIIDIGASYKKFCENLSGQYIPLGLVENFSVNPFDLPADEVVPSSAKIKFLVGLVEMMTKEDDALSLHKLERTTIEEAIQRVYDTSKRPRLSDLKDILIANPDVIISNLGKILNSWCGNTAYGKFVDKPTSATLNSSIVCFDLKGLESHPDLQAVCLYIITDFIWRETQRDRGVKKFIVFDECWKLLENEAGSAFIAEVFRTLRKYFGSAIAISQNIDDFAKSKVAGAILPNTAVKWLLMQGESDPARLKEVLRLNDNEMALVSELEQERGVFSHAFLMAGENRSVVAIESTPEEYWIATTDPRDLAAFDAAQSLNPKKSKIELIQDLSEKYPHGVASSKSKTVN